MKRRFVNNNGRTKPVFEGEGKFAAPDWSPAEGVHWTEREIVRFHSEGSG